MNTDLQSYVNFNYLDKFSCLYFTDLEPLSQQSERQETKYVSNLHYTLVTTASPVVK